MKLCISRVFMILILLTGMIYGQGVTTAAINGKITDAEGAVLIGANVIAEHTPTGTTYGASTMKDGYYYIPNMKIGGPYVIRVSYIGYTAQQNEGVQLFLNNEASYNFSLQSESMEMGEVVVTAEHSEINPNRTGAETSINAELLESLPTISRGQKDFTRMTPESDGNSFGGRNNLYNNFSLDGSIFNNPFGLDYAVPGGQTEAQPVSLDAIEQVQVSLAPFDVREGGFTGAGVNAVTKSGTNTFKASVYHYLRSEAMVGTKVGDVETENLDFSTSQSGISLGGPIIKDKIFFFVNVEAERRDQLAHNFIADDGSTGANVTSVNADSIALVQARLRDYWGYEPGAYQGYNHETFNNKLLAKIDWNISSAHNLTFRYNYLDSWKDILPHPEAIIGRGPTSFRLPFENSSYRIFNKINSYVAELNSRFSNKLANKLLVGYTMFRDEREPKSVGWPVVDIFDGSGNLAISMGSEMFSTHNRLYQDVFQFTDNLTYYMDKHTLTAGVNLEILKFDNSFNLFYYPWNTFGSVQEFLNNDDTEIDFNAQAAASDANDFAWAYVDVGQLGIYAQDQFRAADNLKLTLGLRMDYPLYLNELEEDTGITGFGGWVDEDGNSADVDPSTWPEKKPLFAPRFGFNWDVRGDKTMQLRGGSGIFTGRIPFVWLGNQASNAKMSPFYTFQINDTADDFNYPQVWKSDIAIDKTFGDDWLVSLEAIFSKDVNAVVHRNYNMLAPSANLSGTGDTRPMFAGFNEVNIYSAAGVSNTFLDAGAIILDNTDEGFQQSLTGKIAKAFDFGVTANMAYTNVVSKDLTSIPAEIAADAFQRNPTVDGPNSAIYSYSRYGLKHRVISSAVYKKTYGKMSSSVAMFFETGVGNRYSFTYAGDLNGDAIGNNDLLYVPEDANDIHFGTSVDANGLLIEAADAAVQWAALDAFIEQDEYLSTRRGKYAERNGAMLPWFSQLDLKAVQDVSFGLHTLQLSLDVMNIGNMINSAWGVRQLSTTWNPITVNGVDANGVPYFSFNTALEDSYVDDTSIASKWQMQFGVHYLF
ncbi:MAG: TonB-dependent receptor [Candidatus Marinimicrobia bacterium]|nr:TonB-dependent receptor [Candidatus Neomarinimicrobiota bacterium]MBT4946558.1 TonB-dependent receptor [Candidatus Neomarinimicrobiota bacterium]